MQSDINAHADNIQPFSSPGASAPELRLGQDTELFNSMLWKELQNFPEDHSTPDIKHSPEEDKKVFNNNSAFQSEDKIDTVEEVNRHSPGETEKTSVKEAEYTGEGTPVAPDSSDYFFDDDKMPPPSKFELTQAEADLMTADIIKYYNDKISEKENANNSTKSNEEPILTAPESTQSGSSDEKRQEINSLKESEKAVAESSSSLLQPASSETSQKESSHNESSTAKAFSSESGLTTKSENTENSAGAAFNARKESPSNLDKMLSSMSEADSAKKRFGVVASDELRSGFYAHLQDKGYLHRSRRGVVITASDSVKERELENFIALRNARKMPGEAEIRFEKGIHLEAPSSSMFKSNHSFKSILIGTEEELKTYREDIAKFAIGMAKGGLLSDDRASLENIKNNLKDTGPIIDENLNKLKDRNSASTSDNSLSSSAGGSHSISSASGDGFIKISGTARFGALLDISREKVDAYREQQARDREEFRTPKATPIKEKDSNDAAKPEPHSKFLKELLSDINRAFGEGNPPSVILDSPQHTKKYLSRTSLINDKDLSTLPPKERMEFLVESSIMVALAQDKEYKISKKEGANASLPKESEIESARLQVALNLDKAVGKDAALAEDAKGKVEHFVESGIISVEQGNRVLRPINQSVQIVGMEGGADTTTTSPDKDKTTSTPLPEKTTAASSTASSESLSATPPKEPSGSQVITEAAAKDLPQNPTKDASPPPLKETATSPEKVVSEASSTLKETSAQVKSTSSQDPLVAAPESKKEITEPPKTTSSSPAEKAAFFADEKLRETNNAAANSLINIMSHPQATMLTSDKKWNLTGVDDAVKQVSNLDTEKMREKSPEARVKVAEYASWVADKVSSGQLPVGNQLSAEQKNELIEKASSLKSDLAKDGITSKTTPEVARSLEKANGMVSVMSERESEITSKVSKISSQFISENGATAAQGRNLYANDLISYAYDKEEFRASYIKNLIKQGSNLKSDSFGDLDPTRQAQSIVALEKLINDVKDGSIGSLTPKIQKDLLAADKALNKISNEFTKIPGMDQELITARDELRTGRIEKVSVDELTKETQVKSTQESVKTPKMEEGRSM